ncbi:MAG: DUF5615 family PIN-like protein [Patescibacteria group bacterium]|nr:DUF5615 family PIN-like protein [Patescibacteria group bacterium]
MTTYPHKFKFYLDENFPVPAGKFLKSRGQTVVEGLKILKKPGLTDQKHLETCIKEEAILLAFDRDFIIDSKYQEMIRKSYGVILIEATDTKPKTAQRILVKVLKKLTKNSIKGKICCASIDKIKFIEPKDI